MRYRCACAACVVVLAVARPAIIADRPTAAALAAVIRHARLVMRTDFILSRGHTTFDLCYNDPPILVKAKSFLATICAIIHKSVLA